jgi:hypothetical protein
MEKKKLVADPPTGVAGPPPVKEKKNEGGRSTHREWLATPRPWGWLGHHQTGRSGGGRATPVAQGGGRPPHVKEKKKRERRRVQEEEEQWRMPDWKPKNEMGNQVSPPIFFFLHCSSYTLLLSPFFFFFL